MNKNHGSTDGRSWSWARDVKAGRMVQALLGEIKAAHILV
jgi:hypothetical protein